MIQNSLKTLNLQFDSLSHSQSTANVITDVSKRPSFNFEQGNSNSSASQNKEIKYYTNRFLPSLKVAYFSDWKLETSTKPSPAHGVVERTINISKFDQRSNRTIQVKITTTPYLAIGGIGCGGTSDKIVSLKNGINRINVGGEFSYVFGDCMFKKAISNISNSQIPANLRMGNENANLEFLVFIDVFSNGNMIDSDLEIFKEIDLMLENSSF